MTKITLKDVEVYKTKSNDPFSRNSLIFKFEDSRKEGVHQAMIDYEDNCSASLLIARMENFIRTLKRELE